MENKTLPHIHVKICRNHLWVWVGREKGKWKHDQGRRPRLIHIWINWFPDFLQTHFIIFHSTALYECNDIATSLTQMDLKPTKSNILAVTKHSPGLHVPDDAAIILMTFDATLELVEQVSQLHANHQAGHAQEDISPQLQRIPLDQISWSHGESKFTNELPSS